MFKLLRNNSIKSISFRSNSTPTTKQLIPTTSQLVDSINQQRNLTTTQSSKMLPINKLAHDLKKRYSTQKYTPEEIGEIRATYQKFEEKGKDFDVPVPWGNLI